MTEAPSRIEILRNLRFANIDAAFNTAFATLVAGTFLVGFIKHLGGADFWIGLLSAIPSLVGIFQIPGAIWGRRHESFKPFIGRGALLNRLFYIPLIALPFLPIESAIKLTVLAVCVAAASAWGTMVSPVHNDWLAEMVPADSRGAFFSRRNAIATAVGAGVGVLAALAMDWLRDKGSERLGFTLVFSLGLVCAGIGFAYFLRMRDLPRPNPVRQPLREALAALQTPFADPNFRRVLTFMAVFVVGQTFAGSLFTAYALESLKLPFTVIQFMVVFHAVGNVLTAGLWGFLSDKYGNKPTLLLAGIGVTLTPVMWLLTFPGRDLENAAVLLSLHVFVGAVWAGIALCQFNLMLATARPEERGTYIAAGLSTQAIIGGIAPLLGAQMLTILRGNFDATEAYKIVFAAVIVLRGSSLFLLRPIQEEGSSAFGTAIRHLSQATPGGYRAMRSLVRSADVESREQAIDRLASEHYTLGADEVAKALHDPSPRVRRSAASALARIGDRGAADALIHQLQEHPDLVEEETVEALGELGSDRAVPALLRYLQSPRSLLRRAAAKALGRIGSGEAAEALIGAAAEPGDIDLRRAALQALRLIWATGAESAIGDALYDPHPSVRIAAAEAVAELGLSGVAPNLRKSLEYFQDEAASEVAYALGAVGSEQDIPAILREARHCVSVTTRRRCLLGVARLLGVEREAYRLLLLEGMARDTALMERLRPLLGRRSRVRSALEKYSQGDEAGALALLAQAAKGSNLEILAECPVEELFVVASVFIARRR